jgi:polyribonucleotide nucleotidyltransferase
LAEKSIVPVIPDVEDFRIFNWAMRISSEVMESNSSNECSVSISNPCVLNTKTRGHFHAAISRLCG